MHAHTHFHVLEIEKGYCICMAYMQDESCWLNQWFLCHIFQNSGGIHS